MFPSPPPAAPEAATKARLREQAAGLRRGLSPQAFQNNGQAAQGHILSSARWREARSVALYVGVKQETPTDLLLDAAWTAGRVVWLPRVRHGQPGCMDFALCSGPQDLRPGPFGLREPTPALPGLGPEALGAAFSPDLFILPGLLFDLRGGRLGYGGGYYDRFLRRRPACPLLGLCFSCQVVPTLPLDPWDQRVDHLCTERGLQCLK